MTIPIVYFRSSSFNACRTCELLGYIEYTLGIRGKGNKAADKGTIVHKALEICALAQKAEQDGIKLIVDEDIGEVETDNYTEEYLENICSRAYRHYTKQFDYHEWLPLDYKHCLAWTWEALRYKDGMFDPRNRKIVAAEPFFDFKIEKDWAAYDYTVGGERLKGNLGLKGAIDLITDLGEGVYEVIDWKSGSSRKDWATGKEKDQWSLFSDPQLRLYHYACKQMYPDVHTFLVTIFFIRAGGAYTVHFQDSDLEKTEELIKKRFEHTRDIEVPKTVRQTRPSQGWRCKRMCYAGQTTFEDTKGIKAEEEKRFGQYTRYGETMSKCEQIRHMIDKYGIEWVTDNYKDSGHTIGDYGHGGGKLRDSK